MNSSSSNAVWLIIDSLTFGGIETHLLELAKGLKQFKTPVKVWILRQYSEPPLLLSKLQSANIDVDYLQTSKRHYLPTLISKIRQYSPAVVHAHGYKASLACKLARVITGIRQVSTYHAGETPSGRVWLYDCLDRYSAFVSSASIAVSDKIANKLPVASQSFNNFIDSNGLANSKGNEIAFVGRLSHEKAPDRFVELARLNQELNFHIYGDGPMSSTLRSSAPTNLSFHGHQTNMDKVWQNVGILIICSRYEGLPMTAIEAMARGIIVISLDVGNLPKLIRHGQNGYMTHSMTALSDALNQYLASDVRHRTELKAQAVHAVNSAFSVSAVIPQLLALYFPHSCHSDYQIEK
ncbi:glycosyltransferase [Vibrio aquaticus]|uniref:Glycosyltransferase n=1 Tax=Vibrio aquaticus TaxID=2496559 RepID=A0A3S0ML54_9VIBR|nr:glycosyltransferase family 4 protein [Vibrio aquaticus]RTZ16806.1 glycosyltransferase [Vibrio aquaticus]